MERYRRLGKVKVYTPMDEEAFILTSRQVPFKNYTANPCRIAAQVVTSVEIFAILALLEGMRNMKLPWIPVSLHHNGCV
jgi:hypothetical protein